MKKLFLLLSAFGVTLLSVGVAVAAEGATAGGGDSTKAAIAIAAGLGVAIAAFGAALGQGRVGAAAMESIGRNPNAPTSDVPIPARAIVKFKPGKLMRTEVLKLPSKPHGQGQPSTSA